MSNSLQLKNCISPGSPVPGILWARILQSVDTGNTAQGANLCCSDSWVVFSIRTKHYLFLIFLPAILIPACASSSPAFLMMYSVYKLNKQGDNIQPWHTPFPFWNQSIVPCPVLTVASWPAYSFSRASQVVWYSHLFQNFPQFVMIHTVKGFDIVNKAEIEVFLELLLFPWSSGCWQFDFWFLCLF